MMHRERAGAFRLAAALPLVVHSSAMPETDPPRLLRTLADQYAAALRTVLGPRLVAVVLFGSVARGEATLIPTST
jgi:hypothetical protein